MSSKEVSHKVTVMPFNETVTVSSGTILLDAIRQANLPIRASCGGKGTCGECFVHVSHGRFHCKASAVLSDKILSEGYTLACQTKVEDDLVIDLPRFQELSIKSAIDHSFLDEHRDRISGVYEVNPPLKKIDVEIPAATLEDNYSDLKRLQRELKKTHGYENIHCEYSVLKKLAHTVRKDRERLSVVLSTLEQNPKLLNLLPSSSGKKIFGIACDIGTSTVALHLVDLASGEIVETASSYNQQMKCGEDIISRIHYSQKSGRLAELHCLIIDTVNRLIVCATASAGISTSDVYYAVASGNTTMIHLFLNLDPEYIRLEPYVPTFNQPPVVLSRELGLQMNHEARIYCTPAVGSYVGGDITSGLLCTSVLRDPERIVLFIDAGTNGELVVGNKDWLLTCACSAGPAFEGAGIRYGMPASGGAVEAIRAKHGARFEYTVIDSQKPKGLCGSGLVDLLAELFVSGMIDRSGRFVEEKTRGNIVETEEGRGFLVVDAKESFWGHDIVITEKDIANLIRTKGAVFSACAVLLKSAGLGFDAIDSVFIAGGFGQHLNIESAIRIGLLPDIPRDRFLYVGNSSLLGAYLVLVADRNREIVQGISKGMTYIELNTEPRYMNEYTGSLFLPHTDLKLFPTAKEYSNAQN